jgi:hypothetical protein
MPANRPSQPRENRPIVDAVWKNGDAFLHGVCAPVKKREAYPAARQELSRQESPSRLARPWASSMTSVARQLRSATGSIAAGVSA